MLTTFLGPTGATLESIVRLQLKGHDHAVKPSQLSRRYQHAAEERIRVSYILYINILVQYYTVHLLHASHRISLRSSSFSGLSRIAKSGRTKSSITLSDKN